MATPAANNRWTRAEVVALIDASPLATPRYELVHGELFDVELEPEALVQPDVFVVPLEEGQRLVTEMSAHRLLLAAEVISPASARGDRGRKRALFQRRVPEYWILDLDARLIERWRSGEERPEILREWLEWKPEGAIAPFRLEPSEFFSGVSGIPR